MIDIIKILVHQQHFLYGLFIITLATHVVDCNLCLLFIWLFSHILLIQGLNLWWFLVVRWLIIVKEILYCKLHFTAFSQVIWDKTFAICQSIACFILYWWTFQVFILRFYRILNFFFFETFELFERLKGFSNKFVLFFVLELFYIVQISSVSYTLFADIS